MAVRITKYGGESYDPKKEILKKLGYTAPVIPTPTARAVHGEDKTPPVTPILQPGVSNIKVTRTEGMTPEEINIKQVAKNKQEIARMYAEGGRRALPTPEALAAFERTITPGGEAGFTPEQQQAEGITAPLTNYQKFSNAFKVPLPEGVEPNDKSIREGFFAALDIFRQLKGRTLGGTPKEPLTLAQATTTFSKVMGSLKSDIADINTGMQDPTVTRIKLIQAQNAINAYERYQKNYDWANLGYWADEGAEMDSTLLIMKEALTEIEGDLLIAKQQWLTRQYMAQPY